LSRGSSDEARRTLALCGSVDDLALSVDSAHTFALARALAFVVETGLIGRTVVVGSTSGHTGSGDAGLADWTLAVCQTEERAPAVQTTFSLGAIVFRAADQFAFTAVAGGSGTVGIRAADLWRTDASLVRCRIGRESGRTTADRLVVGAPAGAVGSAESIARIHATSFKAGGFRRAVVVSAGAGSVGPTSVNVRIADGIRLAGADGSSGHSLAEGRLVARIGGA